MNRRFFLAATTATLVAPKLLLANSEVEDYTPGLVEKKLAAGDTVLVDYAASWCSTCKRQERIIAELRDENPELNEHISFIRVDWDNYGRHEVATSRRIPRRSTLVLLKGNEELGRIVAGTRREDIKILLGLALPAG